MKISGVTTFLHLLVVLSFIIFFGLFLNLGNFIVAFEGAPGGDGNAGPAGEGGGTNTIAGRFFNDRNSNGTWEKDSDEELIFSTTVNGNGFGNGVACSMYTGPKMTLSGIFAIVRGVKYPPNGCARLETSTSSSTTFGSPAYYTEYIPNGATTITTEIPIGWSCSTISPGCTRNVNIGIDAYVLPIGIKQNPLTCTGPITINSWTDNPIVANVTKIKKVHIEELRYWINIRRTDAGLQPFSWTDPVITANTTKIKKLHITELRTAIEEVYTRCGQTPLPSWTDSTITPNATKIKAKHITELRERTEEAK